MYCARLVPAIVLIRYVYIYSQRLEVQIAVAYITFIMSDKVKINVGGQLFLTKRSTLQRRTGKKNQILQKHAITLTKYQFAITLI